MISHRPRAGRWDTDAQAMKKKYLLPCTCGQELEVETAQAGLSLKCSCGAEVQVPTLAGIRKLRESAAQTTTPSRYGSWGPRQAMVFLGTMLAALALAAAAIVFATTPPMELEVVVDRDANQRQFDELTAAQTIDWWNTLSQGPDIGPEIFNFDQHRAFVLQRRRWVGVLAALAIGGLIMAVSGLFVRSAPAPPPRTD